MSKMHVFSFYLFKLINEALLILKPIEKRKFYFLILFNLIVSIADILSIIILVLFISKYAQTDSNKFHSYRLFDWLFEKDPSFFIILLIAFFTLKSLFGYWVFKEQYNFVYRISSRISEANLQQYLENSYSNYVQIDSSVHVRQIMQQPVEFAHYVLAGILQIFNESIILIFTMMVLLIFNPLMFVLLIIALLPPVLLIAKHTKRKLKNARANVKATHEITLQYLHEALAGYIESNIYGKNYFFRNRYASYQYKLAQYLSDVQTTSGITSRFMELFAILGLLVMIIINKYFGNHSVLEILNISAFMAAAYKIIPGIIKVSNSAGQVKTYEHTINGLSQQNNLEVSKIMKVLNLHSIEFDCISYKYNNNIVFNKFYFEIKKGDFIGIFGASGKGKTTFVNLLLGFLTEDTGKIKMNNDIVSQNERKQFWNNIAYIQQRPFLIHDTVLSNIVLNNGDYDAQKLSEVVAASGLDVYIDQHSEGLRKIITENGRNISGGQRQRIAIARGLYKDADLIILDEPFSEMDSISELHILEYLTSLSLKGKMIIIISHKKENLKYCNKTYKIE